MDVIKGLTYPGKCDSCVRTGPRFRFRNEYADPVIQFDLCPACAAKAYRAVEFFLRTPAGIEARKEQKGA